MRRVNGLLAALNFVANVVGQLADAVLLELATCNELVAQGLVEQTSKAHGGAAYII